VKTINIHDAKTHLSSYVREVKAGKSLVLCERNVPVAEIRPIKPAKSFKQRKLGCMKGSILFMSDKFNEPLKGKELALFEDAPL
jgi:prevent-host-death family protein